MAITSPGGREGAFTFSASLKRAKPFGAGRIGAGSADPGSSWPPPPSRR